MSDDSKKTIWESVILPFIKNYLLPVGSETLRLLPDSVIVGTAILTAISLCNSYGVLLLTMIEVMVIQRLLGGFIGGMAPIGAGDGALQMICQPGFYFGNTQRISLLEVVGVPSLFPSPVMFFLAAILSYMTASIHEFSREIKSLGYDVEARSTVATILSFFLLIAMLAFRYSYGCESFGPLFLSMLFGLIIGGFLMIQNKALFGREGVNLMNIPMIVTGNDTGKPMYVCAP
jgi:hypothetical protein